jgi:predicted PurR-regulated permease PerM
MRPNDEGNAMSINTDQVLSPRSLLDVLITAGLIAVLAVFSYDVFRPFLNLMLWSMILAVTLYPLHKLLKARLGSDGRAATVIVLIGLATMLTPIYLLGMSLVDSAEKLLSVVKSGEYHIPPPPESVSSWPIVGERLHATWLQASTDLTPMLKKLGPQLKDFSMTMVGTIAGVGVGFLAFVAALLVAGIFMAFGENGSASAVHVFSRITGAERGPKLAELCTATIRAVAQGVVGIAFIQMLLIGVAFLVKGIPGAGLLALVTLMLGIMQLPATLITLPVIGVVFAMEGATVGTVVFAVYTFVAGLADNVLKPLLLGRGLDVPMPVVLIGAIGGMIASGIIGLFIGPVILAVSYQLFWQWVDQQQPAAENGVQPPT